MNESLLRELVPTVIGVLVRRGAEVSEITTRPGDEVGRELLGTLSRAAKPEDEDAFLEQMVAERRVVIRLTVDRLYGTAFDIEG
ncbi:hypothetical protein [Nocardiopsis ansamitocini]|uniref:Uncharacterized protein n=1 Tax=Nocardiopsis ansamitocini TaxID=1670832 RepID=A0A9W6P6X7_9ACTN|nr:hypothetical protein [Nocardiopsis ansamitocini]GLU48300.1 hypothetical protein Nans01_26510 [Nocardiopsis ansamitocini]